MHSKNIQKEFEWEKKRKLNEIEHLRNSIIVEVKYWFVFCGPSFLGLGNQLSPTQDI